MRPVYFRLVAFVLLFALAIPVRAASWWQPYTGDLFEKEVIDSAEDNLFRPNEYVNRAELAKMLNRAVIGVTDSSLVINPGFGDVSVDDWYFTDVAALHNLGVINGFEDNTFRPESRVTRAAALKMITLVFEFTAGDDQLPFNDVSSENWFYDYVRAGYRAGLISGIDGSISFAPGEPLTRAAMAKMLSKAIETKTGGEEDITTEMLIQEEAPPSKLIVSLASDSPIAGIIPVNAFNIPYAYINFQVEGESSIYIKNLTVSHGGFGNPSHFESIRLYKGMTQIGVEKRLSVQTRTAAFNLNYQPLEIPPGVTVKLQILADMNFSDHGFSNSLGIANAEHITATTYEDEPVEVTGSFPVVGGELSSSSATVGDLEYTMIDPHGSTPTEFGLRATRQLFSSIELDPKDGDTELTSITFRNNGSARDEDVDNLSLYEGGRRVAGPVSVVDRFVTLSFYPPLIIKKNRPLNLDLIGDLPGGFDKTVGFDIYNDWHIRAASAIYGYPVRIIESPSNTPIVPDLIH